MNHSDLDKLYDEVLGRGLYTPQVLLPRIKRAIALHGFDVSLETSGDLKNLPAEAIPVAMSYLRGQSYQATPDVDRAAAPLARKRTQSGMHRKTG